MRSDIRSSSASTHPRPHSPHRPSSTTTESDSAGLRMLSGFSTANRLRKIPAGRLRRSACHVDHSGIPRFGFSCTCRCQDTGRPCDARCAHACVWDRSNSRRRSSLLVFLFKSVAQGGSERQQRWEGNSGSRYPAPPGCRGSVTDPRSTSASTAANEAQASRGSTVYRIRLEAYALAETSGSTASIHDISEVRHRAPV